MIDNKILYFVTDSTGLNEDEFLNIVESACKGGADIVQLREKNKSTRAYIELGIKVKEITDRYSVPLIIDDRVDVCLAVDSAGVHLGTDDMNIDMARKILGPDKIIGSTAKNVKRAQLSEVSGADYLGVGAVYPTTTKVKTVITEVSVLKDIAESVDIPVFAIGGLNDSNIDILEGSGFDGVCAVSAIMKSDNPEEYVRNFKKRIIEIKNRQ